MTKITSNFNRGSEGWTIAGDVSEFNRQPSGGNPGGYLFWRDAASGAIAYWQAPDKFEGDLSAYRGGRLSFDWYSSGGGLADSDVKITGANGTTIVTDLAEPGSGWTHAAVRLSTAGHWHIDTLNGATATKAQINAVLADVTAVEIRAEHVNGAETGGLDSVALVSKQPRPIPDAFGADRHEAAHGGGWGAEAIHHLGAEHVQLA